MFLVGLSHRGGHETASVLVNFATAIDENRKQTDEGVAQDRFPNRLLLSSRDGHSCCCHRVKGHRQDGPTALLFLVNIQHPYNLELHFNLLCKKSLGVYGTPVASLLTENSLVQPVRPVLR